MSPWIILPLLLLLVLFVAGLLRVPEQRVLNTRRGGRYRRTLGPGWHWVVPGLERTGLQVDLLGHHVRVRGGIGGGKEADLYYQIMEPEKAGETLDRVDDWVSDQAHEALGQPDTSPDQLKSEINRRVARLGLRVVRCSLHLS